MPTLTKRVRKNQKARRLSHYNKDAPKSYPNGVDVKSGTHPRMYGKYLKPQRAIPACMGNTLPTPGTPNPRRSHPRVYGKYAS